MYLPISKRSRRAGLRKGARNKAKMVIILTIFNILINGFDM